ncbi:MAG: hypothetical protein JSU69_01080 [Candidatus Zixiibacteriota bacterium]|nr:MAG: hypothetical protein JSU69_01080 [candidate division Zixibacteria bacterium]
MNYQSDEEKSPEVSGKPETEPAAGEPRSVIFAAYAESEEGLRYAYFLAESIREFAGRFKDAPVWVYVPEDFDELNADLIKKFSVLGVEIKTSHAPNEALWFYFAGKVFAAGEAEAAAEGKAAVLVWMDEDTIVLQEPKDFMLDKAVSYAYRPVMHNRSGSLYGEKPNAFWSRIYEKLGIDDEALFPMVTPADRQKIRAYFNAGLLVVRPEKGILRKWGEDFTVLYSDSILAQMCRDDVTNRIFIHQTALVGAVLNLIDRSQMVELSEDYNYPIFFHQQWEAEKAFDSIDDIVTLRYDIYFRNPDPEWSKKLKGPANIVAWLKQRLGKE